MEEEFIYGGMVENTKGNIKKIKNVVMECTFGAMEDVMKGFGKMENRVEKENTFFRMELKKWVNGIKEEELDGLMGKKI